MNPEVKKGDKIILKKSVNGLAGSKWMDTILEVYSTSASNGYITVKMLDATNGTASVYLSNDEYILADRESQVAYAAEKVENCKRELKNWQIELERLSKFESEEEYTAYKIDQLLKANGVKAKAEILKELRATHFL